MTVLAATSQVPGGLLERYAFSGQLSLKGELMPTPGVLSVAIGCVPGRHDSAWTNSRP